MVLVLLALVTGCASGRVVRLERGRGPPLVFRPGSDEAEPVELERREFKDAVARLARERRPSANPPGAARQLFGVDTRSGVYLVNPRTHRVTPLEGSALVSEAPEADVELTRAYLLWCERTGRTGDCLRLLVESPVVNGDGRFALALALAKGAVLDEMLEAFKDMADPHAMVAAVLWTWTTYMVLLSIPDVTVSKGLAAAMTATLISYVGVDTFWGLVVGFKRLMDEADRAASFNELREAGERYGKVMGRNAARAFAMLATVALGSTATGLAAKVPTLPGVTQAAAQAETQLGINLVAVGEVETVAVSAATVSITLAPNAVAMSAGGGQDTEHVSGELTRSASDIHVDKVVNSNMPHAAERAVERAGFSNVQDARTALQEFGRQIEKSGLPPGTIRDTAHVDRVIVPGFGRGGAIVYQFRDGVLKLKTVLQWRP
ncbi:hypothetical protein P2318_09975 [Myxococcaceae bacterium GXIMD 01537]